MARSGNPPILVPVDFSPNSETALAFAMALAGALKAPLVVLHVVHDPADDPGYYTRALGNEGPPQLRKLEDLAAAMMEEFLARFYEAHPECAPPRELKTELVVGLPVARILEMIERLQPQLVVIGSRGRSSLSNLLLGSKAEQVARLSPVPVTLVKPPPEAPQPPTPENHEEPTPPAS